MGESLIDSWLNHVKNCQLHQTNFKLTENWEIPNRKELGIEYQDLMEKAEHEFEGVFKSTKTLDELLKYAEIDNMGVDFINNKLYAVDIAFHEAGLNYTKNGYSTAMNIAKKFLRTIFLIKIYFPTIEEKSIIFASPKVTPKPAKDLEDMVEKLKLFITSNKLNINIELYINEKFKKDIYDKLIDRSTKSNDTSELFLRSMKLHELCTNITFKGKKKNIDNSTILIDKPRVGVLAKDFFTELLNDVKIDNDLLELLQKKEYSKKELDVNFPIIHKGIENIDKKRYYSRPLIDDYYLTNDWYEKSRDKLEIMIENFSASVK